MNLKPPFQCRWLGHWYLGIGCPGAKVSRKDMSRGMASSVGSLKKRRVGVYLGAVELDEEDKMVVVLWGVGDWGKATVKLR